MKDEIKIIEYNGIEGYIELMKHDVEALNNPECKRIELLYDGKTIKAVLDYITNLQEENSEQLDENLKLSEWLVKKQKRIEKLEKENDYLKDIVSNTELSDEIKKADKWSKRELYKINYQRLQMNKRLRKENERLNNIIEELEKDIKEDNQKAREYMKKVEQSGMCQGDYPVHYYYADKRIGLTEKYLERLKELKGNKANLK